jgi:hypothetical protein
VGSAAGLGVSTFGEGGLGTLAADGFRTFGGEGFGIAGGMGVSARADALMIKAIAATMAKVRMLASSPDHSRQSSLIQGTDLHGSEMIRADHSPPMLGSVGRVKPPWTSVSGVPHNPCREQHLTLRLNDPGSQPFQLRIVGPSTTLRTRDHAPLLLPLLNWAVAGTRGR